MPQRAADLIFLAGHVWTGRTSSPSLDSVAIADGRITAVGPAGEVRSLRGPRTRIVPIGGGLLLPCFQDAHVHPVLAGVARLGCDLSGLETVDEWLAVIAAYAARLPPGVPLVGDGWIQHVFPGGIARRELLDRVVPDRPVVLDSRDSHSRWLNSAALAAGGITRSTPDPPLGRIERDADGEPSGTLQETATHLVDALVPPVAREDMAEGLRLAQAHLHALGIGAWHDADVAPEHETAYLDLFARGELTGRASLALRWEAADGVGQLPALEARRRAVAVSTRSVVRAESVKLFQDGVLESCTAALLSPYLDAGNGVTDTVGQSFYEPDELLEVCAAISRAGFGVHAHAIGDRAVREVLDALEASDPGGVAASPRHAIAHLELVDAADLPRFGRLGVIASVQPLWACHDPDTDGLHAPRLGTARLEARYPLGSLARAGATLAFGSDWSVSTADPLAILDVAVRRTPPDDPTAPPLGRPEERLTPEAALRAFTLGSAMAGGIDHPTGTIEVGKAADLVLLDRDPLAPGMIFSAARVMLTIVDGRVVHQHPDQAA